ncbi:MAG: S-layer homology domain-containing protein [Clostridia bacterium]|nr:S-layer homology domain-containing protein [Clostridia bacterium]
MKKIFFFSCVFIFLFTQGILASNKISPAIDVIASESSMVKSSVLADGELNFDIDDFDNTVGVNVSEIKITALPSSEVGRLMLDNLYVVENQVIKREDFSLLKFVGKSESYDATFKFKPNGHDYEIECSLVPLSSVNLSPVGSNGATVSALTMKNLSCFGTLLAYDPEGDELEFEIVSYPKKALVCITNKQTGDYIYTPYENARGKDSFSYRVHDSYGNYSEVCSVEINIENKKANFVFSDVDKIDLYAVNVVCEVGLMDSVKNADGSFSFNPNEEITREEFIALIMDVMGAKDVPQIEKTRFADDKDISPKYKGYLESAFSLGIITGTNEVDGVHINPKRPITLAEGAVIINNIIGAKKDTCLTVFADDDDIPGWARESIESLTEAGILKKDEGKISPNQTLTKAQVATILMSLLKYKK